jgi:TRAP-type transport system periplasmic protein
VLTLALSITAAASAMTMNLGHFGKLPETGDPLGTAAQAFADKVTELSGGALTVDVRGDSVLGNAKEMIEQTQQGLIEACLVSQGTLDKFDIRYAFVTAPYMFSGYAQAYAVVDGPFADWVNDGTLEAAGLHNIGPWDYGFRMLTNSVREVKTPEDVAGLLLRTPSEVQKVACFEALGATVQPLAFSELLPALKQGTFDGQENPIATIVSFKMWEVNQKYVSLTRHTWESVNLVVNWEWWQSLTAEEQGWITQADYYARDLMRGMIQDAEAYYVGVLEENGVLVTTVDLSLFKAKMAPAWAAVSAYAGDTDGSMLAKFLEIVDSTAE